MKKSPRDSWRLEAISSAPSGFDELVIGEWFHIERMDTGAWWLRLGDKEADITVSPKGKAIIKWRE